MKLILARMNDLKNFSCFEVTCIQKSPKRHMCRFCFATLNKRKMKLLGHFNYETKQIFTCKHCYKEFIKICELSTGKIVRR
jgi:hypothetical protein